MNYAIIQLAGKQFKVSPDQELVIDRQSEKIGDKITVEDVLLTSDGKTVAVGSPLVKNAKVTLTVKDHVRGKKIRVATYKSKSKYRRVKGHRQEQTVVTVNKITA
ncbi:MAG: 50S ribosomal protein L21 [Patescibacteria group bacterium]